MITAILLAGALYQTQPDVAAYQNLQLNLAFNHPKTWKISIDKKISSMKAEMPLGDSGDKAILEVFPTIFGAQPTLWQNLQVELNRQNTHDVTRQWQEEIIGVPILLTLTHYYDHGVEKRQLTGLIYNRWIKKMLFHLTSSASSYANAELEWRTALQSLHTLDGSAIIPETPDRPLTTEEMKPNINPGITKVTELKPIAPRMRVRKAKMTENVTVGGKAAVLHYPQGWTLAKTDNGFKLSHPEVGGAVTLALNSLLDSDTPEVAMAKTNGVVLPLFDAVKRRDETSDVLVGSGSRLSKVWRNGTAASGPLTTLDACGLLGDNYWQLSYRSGSVLGKHEIKILTALVEQMSVDAAPAAGG